MFDDDKALLLPDPDHSADEARWVLLGMSGAAHVLVGVHCERGGGDTIRLISTRKADRVERETYADRRS